MKDLRDKWVLITGAAGGIGRALTLEFTSKGSNVIMADIDEEGMESVAAEVRAGGGKAIAITADVTRPEDLDTLTGRAIDKAGRVDILVNNAGVAMVSEVKDTTWDEWEKILAVNLLGPIQLTSRLLPHMISNGRGHIVNIASMAGLMGIPGLTSYSVTKFGMVGFSEALRAELHSYGIDVTAVCPGVVNTPIIHTSPIKGFDEEMRNPPSVIMISPEKAAREIVRGVRRNKAKVIPSTPPKIIYALKKILPGPVEFILIKAYSQWERTPV